LNERQLRLTAEKSLSNWGELAEMQRMRHALYNSKYKSDEYQKLLVVATNIYQCCLAMNHI